MAEPTNSVPNGAASELPVSTAEETLSRARRTLRLFPNYERPSPGRAPLFRQ